MSNKKDLFFIEDILNSADKILRYTENLTFETFKNDEKTIDAVERNFEIIGEAVKNLSDELKTQHAHIPFKAIAGMRDKLIHDYFGVDYNIVFKTIKDKIPEFREEINKIKQLLEK